MKLFQIEEPDGSSLRDEGPGAAIGIALSPVTLVAASVGGNAEILPPHEGALPLPSVDLRNSAALAELLLALRERAEKTLARPVTHAVIAVDAIGEPTRRAVEGAAAIAGLTVLRLIDSGAAAALARGAPAAQAAALGAAIAAEEDARGLSS